MNTTRRIHRSPAQWREIFTRFEANNLSTTAFYKQQGIAYGSLMRWRQWVDAPTRHAAQTSAGDWLPIQLATGAGDDSSTAQSWSIELVLLAGVQLRMRRL